MVTTNKVFWQLAGSQIWHPAS